MWIQTSHYDYFVIFTLAIMTCLLTTLADASPLTSSEPGSQGSQDALSSMVLQALEVDSLTDKAREALNKELAHPSNSKIRKNRRKITARKSRDKSKGGKAVDHERPCCLNGGLCVLGTFCYCKKDFHGRRCQHSYQACGPIPHDTTLHDGCSVCTCFDGFFQCIAKLFNCVNQTTLEEETFVNFQNPRARERGKRPGSKHLLPVPEQKEKEKKVKQALGQMGYTDKDLAALSSASYRHLTIITYLGTFIMGLILVMDGGVL